MREIKFRAWAKAEDKMYYADKSDRFRIGFYGCAIYNGDTWADDLVVLQYTGLKDKNGKEIYEGDILQKPILSTSYFSRRLNRQVSNGRNKRKTVIWEQSDFKCGWNVVKSNVWEVIGNIYENPEFIKYDKTL